MIRACFHYYSDDAGTATRARASTARALLPRDSALRRFDPLGVLGHLAGNPIPGRTCFAGIKAGIADRSRSPSAPPAATAGPLLEVLRESLRRALAGPGRAALALSGGLDSALLVALAREIGEPPPVYILAVDLPGYGEREVARSTARALGVEPVVITASPGDLVLALPDTTLAAEAPLRNLHMASKLLLARALRADAIDCAITGDGADQLFAHTSALDYLPLVGAVMASAGVELRSPFLDDAMIEYAAAQAPDPNKRALREAARGRVPAPLVDGVKTPRLAPALDLDPVRDDKALARALASLPFLRDTARSDRAHVQLTSLAWLQKRIIEDTL